jgi:uncharacterized protein
MEAPLRKIIPITLLLLLSLAGVAGAQELPINRQNRTVDVTVTATVSAFANLAEVRFSCDTKSPTHEQAYEKNVEKAARVVKALLDAGIPKDDIVSADISLEEEDRTTDETKSGAKRVPSFEAIQTWTVRVAAPDAQKVVDTVVEAGADTIGDVKWMLSDPDVTMAKARLAAIQKARANASDIANGLGAKLGEVIYVTNVSVSATLMERQELMSNVLGSGGKPVVPPTQKLQLFPERIEKQATVRVVFALD